MNEVSTRYSIPSKYDVAPYGKIYRVMGENDSDELYIQLSENLENPLWKPISYLLEKSFSQFIDNQDFIQQCLCLYSDKSDRHKHFTIIANILSR